MVVDIDRLGRGKGGDRDRITEVFKFTETYIITPDRIYDLNNESDEINMELIQALSRVEYKMIIRRLRRGKKMGAKAGKWTNGVPPFPYKFMGHKQEISKSGLVVDKEKLPAYEEMKRRAVKGETAESIAVDFNRRGILTNRGNYWSGVTVQRLLVDGTHLGTIISNKSKGEAHKKKQSKLKPFKNIPKDEWTVVKNCHEAVKTQEDHDSILTNINNRQKVPRNTQSKRYGLSRLLKCGLCGHSHTFYELRGETYIKPCYYRDKLGNKCRNSGTFNKPVEDAIINTIKRYKNKCLSLVDFQDTTSIESIKREINNNEEAIKKYEKSLVRIDEAYELGTYSHEEWVKRRDKWKKEIDEANTKTAQMLEQLKDSNLMTTEERLERLSYLLENIGSIDDNITRNELYQTVINNIEYTNDGNKVSITINFKKEDKKLRHLKYVLIFAIIESIMCMKN